MAATARCKDTLVPCAAADAPLLCCGCQFRPMLMLNTASEWLASPGGANHCLLASLPPLLHGIAVLLLRRGDAQLPLPLPLPLLLLLSLYPTGYTLLVPLHCPGRHLQARGILIAFVCGGGRLLQRLCVSHKVSGTARQVGNPPRAQLTESMHPYCTLAGPCTSPRHHTAHTRRQ